MALPCSVGAPSGLRVLSAGAPASSSRTPSRRLGWWHGAGSFPSARLGWGCGTDPLRRGTRLMAFLVLSLGVSPFKLAAQWTVIFLPDDTRLPVLLAGARDPVASARLLGVVRNPNRLGEGVEAEVSLGTAVPVLLLRGDGGSGPVMVGMEAAVFARFGLQIVERELVATDWVFAVPVVWYRSWGWLRFRYHHTSSHMGDEYSRRFEDRGVNFSRDAADLFALFELSEAVEAYGGIRYGYNVKPEDSRRWVWRGGAQIESPLGGRGLRPYLAADVEWDEDAGPDPRLDFRVGTWLPVGPGRRALRLDLGVLTGPSPLGQFQGGGTTQVSIGILGRF